MAAPLPVNSPSAASPPAASASRRDFLKTTSASLFAAGFAPAILGAADKSGTKPVVIGEGDFKYECNHRWAQVPKSIVWKNTHGVTIDRDNFIYIKHLGNAKDPCDTIAVFDPQGKFVRSFGVEYAGGGHGIDIHDEDGTQYLYLSDTFNRQVVKCDLSGEWVWKKRYPREAGVYANLNEFRPTNVCFGPNGDLYVGDGYGSSYLHQYNANGDWVRTWGGKGSEPGKMSTPHGQWLDDRPGREPQLVIADRANARLQYFSLDGQPKSVVQGVLNTKDKANPTEEDLQKRMAEYGTFPAEACLPISFPADVDIQGEYMLVPDLHARVLILNGKNQVVANLGYDPAWTAEVLQMKMRTDPSRWQDGKFVHPHDAKFDRYGNIIVCEWVDAGRVTFMRRV